ncbi:hypothetical protein HII13_004864 [Brettanomyces bruxellensis]|nr:hypothetical protein HII13_004864 [Brettanomyces bruxellensis]
MEKLPFRKSKVDAAKTMLVKNSPDNETAKSNCAAVNPQDFKEGTYVILDNKFVFTIKQSTKMIPGAIGLSGNQRFWGSWSTDQSVLVSPYDLFHANGKKGAYLGAINVEVNFWNRNRANSRLYDPDEMADAFVKKFDSQILQPTQILLFEFKGNYFELRVTATQVVDLADVSMENVPVSGDIMNKGIVVQQTQVSFYKGSDGLVNLKASMKRPNVDAIIRPDFKFEDMGIGGLDNEFTSIFRRAFASRIFPPALVEKLGIQHVKGMLLYGPPGTGKTLIARQIGKMLNAKEPKIVNGPEILSKYVGSSEENIRNLFKDAEAEYKQKGDASSLHIIIFDELDSIFKQRGSRGDGTGVADNVVNQLLAKMDGVDQLNNILVIGMTNRRDLIDEALLRPGRFEVQVEIHLPDEEGRNQILEIKTKKMRDNGALASDVDLHKLAKLTKNFSGAELEGLVKSATSFALSRHIKVIGKMWLSIWIAFLNALNEVKPAYGVNEEDLHDCVKGGILKFSQKIDGIINRVNRDIAQLKNSKRFNFSSVLLYGPPGSGKTALAANMALKSKFPFIRMISSDELIGMSESAKVQYIDNTFRDAYKSPLNILIVDDIEAIIDYVPIGPRFSSVILRALMTRMRKPPPESHRLIIPVNNLTSLEELKSVMLQTQFGAPNVEAASENVNKQLLQIFQDGKINIAIKKVLFNIDASKFSSNPVEELVQLTVESNRP